MTEKRTIYWMNDEVWRGRRKVAMNVEGSWGESMPPPCPPLRVSNSNLSGIAICKHQVKRLLHSNLKNGFDWKTLLRR